MKRLVKICLWVALPLILIGGIVAALCVGVMNKNGREKYVTEDRWGNRVLGFSDVEFEHLFHLGLDGNVTTGSADIDFSEISNLEISVGAAEFRTVIMEEGEEGRIEISPSDCKLNVEEKKGTLEIKAGADEKHWKNDAPTVTLYVPGDVVFEEVSIEAGACQTTFERLKLSKELDIDCGAGQIEIELVGEEEDFNYDIDGGIGAITIGSHSFDGIAIDQKIDNGADKDVTIDCGASEVVITFVEE